MNSHDRVRRKLAKVARRLASERRDELAKLKAEHVNLKRIDFVWHYLLQSFATMGRSSGWHGLIGNRANYSRVTYGALSRLSSARREREVRAVCRLAKVRMPETKADYILGCFELVKGMGGLKAARSRLLSCRGRDEKITFLRTFPGIGEKYSRNIMMDVYHEDFRDSIAVDARIKGISSAHGLTFDSFADYEKFYLSVASAANLNGWELDRLMYNFQDEFMKRTQ